MTIASPIPRQVADIAMNWILRREDGLSADEQAALETWRRADPRHEDALTRMERLWRELDKVPAAAALPPVQSGRIKRIPSARWPLALAASLACIWMVGNSQWLAIWRADYSTGVGERRNLVLADGSVVNMDSDTALNVDYDVDGRRLTLLAGRANFIVRPDAGRPFTVEAGHGKATALGTRFIVATDGDESEMVVTEHSVAVRMADDARTARVREGLAIGWGEDGLEPVHPADMASRTSWIRGRLVANAMPLREVVAEIARYRKGYVRLMGDTGAIRVSGVYDLARPDDALNGLQKSLGLRQIRLTDRFIILSQ